MKRLRILLASAVMLCNTAVMAQSAAVKNVAKSVFSLTTFRADGSLLASSHGVFVGNDGEAVSDLTPFRGAAKAVVIDQKGNKMEVTRMLGINDIYNVARFRVNGKTTPAPMASSSLSTGAHVWLVGYAVKNPEITGTAVKSVETFMDKYAYYIFGMNAPDNAIACPFVNDNGEVIGILQVSNTTFDTHATDARFINSLTLNGLSLNNADIRQIGIPIAMPTDLTQAQVLLMMTGQSGDSLKYVAAIDDFCQLFPTQLDGYDARARLLIRQNRFDEAAKTMESAIKQAEKKDEGHYYYGKLIYDKLVNQPNPAYEKWTIDKAMEELNEAYTLSPQAHYRHLMAQITFSKKAYQEAYDMFMSLYQDKDYRNPELLYEAARCKQMLDAPATEVIALLDSAINTTDSLQIISAAPYFLARATAYEQVDSFRQAVFDYSRYEYLVQGRVNANFYYIREQAEVKGHLYQQALTDIARAIILAPEEATYIAEMASLQLRVNLVDQALLSAEQCTKVAPEYSDGYLLLGLAQIKKGRQAEGIANLQKAKELGNPQADGLIEKYSK